MGKKVGLTAALVIALLIPSLPASACSCVRYEDPRDALNRADAAFIGTHTSTRDAQDDPDDAIYTFRVEESVKGNLGDEVEIRSRKGSGGLCEFRPPSGTTGIFLYENEGTWGSSLCSTIEPGELRDAAEDLPQDADAGPTRFLIGGSFGRAHLMALDHQGRIRGYAGEDDSFGSHIDVCPGGDFAVEEGPMVTLRELVGLTVVRELITPREPDGLHCRDADGGRVYAFTAASSSEAGAIYELQDGTTRLVYEGPAVYVAFARGRAYVNESYEDRSGSFDAGRIHRVNLDTRRVTHVADAPRGTTQISLSPDRSRLTAIKGVKYGYGEETSLVVVNLETERLKLRALGFSRSDALHWWGRNRIVLPCSTQYGRSRVFNVATRSLRTQRIDVCERVTLVFRDSLWGVGPEGRWDGGLRSRPLTRGGLSGDAPLPSPKIYSFAVVR